MAIPDPSSVSGATEQFVRLLLANQRRLFRFLFTMVPHESDVDDLFQEVSSVLWRKFSQFRPGTDFGAWAMKIARLEVMKFREKKKTRFCLSLEAMRAVEEEEPAFDAMADQRHEALVACLAKLSPQQMDMVRLRYEEGADVATIAARLGRSAATVYRTLNVIHEWLLACVRRTVAGQGTR